MDPSPPEAVLDHVPRNADVVVPMANGEPVTLLDVLEREHRRLTAVRSHQMHALRERAYMRGKSGDHLRHVSYFPAATRPAYWAGISISCPTTSPRSRGCCATARAARLSSPPRACPTRTATSASGPMRSTSPR